VKKTREQLVRELEEAKKAYDESWEKWFSLSKSNYHTQDYNKAFQSNFKDYLKQRKAELALKKFDEANK